MTDEEIRSTIAVLLADIAPEIDLDAIPPDASLRTELDIDSYDFLRLLVGLEERLGVTTPESDYGQVATLSALIAYMRARLPDGR